MKFKKAYYAWTKCAVQSTECTCSDCPANTYAEYGSLTCKDHIHQKCPAGQFQVGTASPKLNDFKCNDCPANTFSENSDDSRSCAYHSHQTCPVGKYRAGTATKKLNGYTCKPCSHVKCGKNEYQTGSCAGTLNGFACKHCESCGSGQYRHSCSLRNQGRCSACPVSTYSDGLVLGSQPSPKAPTKGENRSDCADCACAACPVGLFTAGDGKELDGDCKELEIEILESTHTLWLGLPSTMKGGYGASCHLQPRARACEARLMSVRACDSSKPTALTRVRCARTTARLP